MSSLFICFMLMIIFLVSTHSRAPPESFDCPMRDLALEFAQYIQPWLSTAQLQQIADALNGSPEAQNCNIKPPQNAPSKSSHTAPFWNDLIDANTDSNTATIYVDYNNGNDNNDGVSVTKPIKHLHSAFTKLRKILGPKYKNTFKRVILRKGKHYIHNTLYFNSNDSNLLITNHNDEHVILSGGLPLNCTWTKYKNGENGLDYYQCKVSTNITDIKGLRVNGKRAIRARYPNGNPEYYPCGFCSNLTASSWLPPTLPSKPAIVINPQQPLRTDGTYWQKYYLGIGGECDNFVPNAGFWCNGEYKIPSGLTFTKDILPNSPYVNATGGVIQAWRPAHWASWMFEIGEYDADAMRFVFSKGGFQGARGNSKGAEFYIENVFEELDYPGEWYFNTSTQMLYYYNNDTSGMDGIEFEVTNVKVIFNYTGDSMDDPLKNVTMRGLTLRDTQYTYMDPHGMPSGGDWALDRIGAVYLDNTEDVMIDNNLFVALDGNGISVNRYNRNMTIFKNEMTLIGSSAITLWGDTMNITGDWGKTSMGYDGTNGNQPRFINVIQNYVHELGIWEKQSSFYFQAKSCCNHIYGNIFYNGPRAGINFNDGFGGNSSILKNLMFNTCRESGDHGPFNSWDRQVYVTKVRNGTASTVKAFDDITQNFIIGNYQTLCDIDNDDGSCWYNVTNNFLVYAECGLKSYAGGHDIIHANNMYGYVCIEGGYFYSACVYDNADQYEGHWDRYYNNTCIINEEMPETYADLHCDDQRNTWPILGNNTVYILGNDTSVTGACGLNETEFQEKYDIDQGTVILPGPPDDDAVITFAKRLLWD